MNFWDACAYRTPSQICKYLGHQLINLDVYDINIKPRPERICITWSRGWSVQRQILKIDLILHDLVRSEGLGSTPSGTSLLLPYLHLAPIQRHLSALQLFLHFSTASDLFLTAQCCTHPFFLLSFSSGLICGGQKYCCIAEHSCILKGGPYTSAYRPEFSCQIYPDAF